MYNMREMHYCSRSRQKPTLTRFEIELQGKRRRKKSFLSVVVFFYQKKKLFNVHRGIKSWCNFEE